MLVKNTCFMVYYATVDFEMAIAILAT